MAVLNADDERVVAFRAAHPGRALTYGLFAHADVRATDVEMNAEGATFTVRGVRFHTMLTGRHNVLNILAGLAVASVFEIDFRGTCRRSSQLSRPETCAESEASGMA